MHAFFLSLGTSLLFICTPPVFGGNTLFTYTPRSEIKDPRYTPRSEIKDPRCTPRSEIKDPRNIIYITKLIHRPDEGLNLKCECILVSAMVHLPQE